MSIESHRHPHNGAIPQHADFLGSVVPFSGANLTLGANMNGKMLRSDGNSNVTVTVPASLPVGFNCGFMMFGTGTITLAPGSGATNRSAKTALSAQYQAGSILVAKNNTGLTAAEYLAGGDFA